ncbi:MAG: hypothetical protein AMJ64_05690 [Betaproteobacteria bacterium SG8_39]|nr:MAG: hypothetical protein AMJ64_05690 [Betaproteobacteria bacterium SG8_39]
MSRRLPHCLVFALACAVMGPAVAADPVWRGNFLVGKPGALFNPCRTGERLLLEDATPGRALEAAYRELARRPGRAIFAEFTGQRDGARIRATGFARAQAEGPGCREDLDEVRLRAYGFNPFVQLELRAASTFLRLRPSGTPREYAGAALRVEEGEARYEGASADSVLRLRVRAKPCREVLSSAIFSYEALLEVDGERYAICAYWGDLGPIPDLPR